MSPAKLFKAAGPALPWLGLTIFYLALTLWMTRPLIGHPDSAVAGPSGDNLYFTWLINWYREALAHHRSPLRVATLNAPEGWNLAYNEMTPTMALLGLPGFLVGGAAFAYNLTFWLSFLLSGLFTALWLWRLTGRVTSGLIPGLIFAFTPYRLGHAFGHLNLLGTQWLPLYFFCFTELLRGNSVWWGVGAGLSLVALAGTSDYYLYMTAVVSIPWAIVLLRGRPGWHRDTRLIKNAVVCAAIAAPFVAVLVWPYVSLARQGLIAPHELNDVSAWSASPTDFVLPSRLHWLVGDWVTTRFKADVWVERTLDVGLVPLALAIVGWWSARRGRQPVALLGLTCVVAAAVAFVLALGTDLHWLGRRVEIPIPPVARLWLNTDMEWTALRLPGYLLFRYLPFYASMRVWMRWGIYVSLFVAVLAGLGFDRLTRARSHAATALLMVSVCVLVLLEFSQKPYPLTAIKGRPVDVWLATQTDGGTVVQLPSDELGWPEETFHTMIHGHPFVGAFFSAFPSPQYSRLEPVLRTFPSYASVDAIRSVGVRWVVVDLARYDKPDAVREQAGRLGLGPIAQIGDQFVFQVR